MNLNGDTKPFEVEEEVIVSGPFAPDLIGKVIRVTPTRAYITDTCWVHRRNGDGHGSIWESTSIRRGTPEEFAAIRRRIEIENLTKSIAITKWSELPLETLRAVVDLAMAAKRNKLAERIMASDEK